GGTGADAAHARYGRPAPSARHRRSAGKHLRRGAISSHPGQLLQWGSRVDRRSLQRRGGGGHALWRHSADSGDARLRREGDSVLQAVSNDPERGGSEPCERMRGWAKAAIVVFTFVPIPALALAPPLEVEEVADTGSMP